MPFENLTHITQEPEATMDNVLSASIGKVLLRLIDTYFPNVLTQPNAPNWSLINRLYDTFLAEFQGLRSEEVYGGDEIREEDVNTIQRYGKEERNAFDALDIYDSSGIQTYCLPLKLVFVLVWKALRDDTAYSDSEDPGYRAFRILSFIQGIRRLQPGICHHGIRNELVLLLNGVYPRVSIIEDLRSFIVEKIKIYLEERFWSQYQIPPKTNKKKRRNQALLEGFKLWVKEGSCATLFSIVDRPVGALVRDLEAILRAHGSDPDKLDEHGEYKPVAASVKDYVKSGLDFNIDSERCPIMRDVRYIFHMTNGEPEILRLQGEIDRNFGEIITTPSRYEVGISQFVRLHQCYLHFSSYRRLLVSVKAITGEVAAQWEARFQEGLASTIDRMFSPNPELSSIQALYEIEAIITAARNDKMVLAVETFFMSWDTGRRRSFALLLDPYFQSFVTMTDDMVGMFERQCAKNKWKDATPYIIHLFILHAILHHDRRVDVNGWSKRFAEVFRSIVRHRIRIESQYRFIFPQIRYMLSIQQDETEDEDESEDVLDRPKGMILLPSQVRTPEEWQTVLSLIEPSEAPRYYEPMAGYLNKLYYSAVEGKQLHFADAFSAIPLSNRSAFVGLFTIPSLIACVSYAVFEEVYDILSPESRVSLSCGLIGKKEVGLFSAIPSKAISMLVNDIQALENRAKCLSDIPGIYALSFEKLGAILAALAPLEYPSFFSRCSSEEYIRLYNYKQSLLNKCDPRQQDALQSELQRGNVTPRPRGGMMFKPARPEKRPRGGYYGYGCYGH